MDQTQEDKIQKAYQKTTEDLDAGLEKYIVDTLSPKLSEWNALKQKLARFKNTLTEYDAKIKGFEASASALKEKIHKALDAGENAEGLKKQLDDRERDIKTTRDLADALRDEHIKPLEETLKKLGLALREQYKKDLAAFKGENYNPILETLGQLMLKLREDYDGSWRRIGEKLNLNLGGVTKYDIPEPSFTSEKTYNLLTHYLNC